jgi:hypothetical protein
MRFVSRYLGYKHQIQVGRSRRVHIEGDSYELVWSEEFLVAEFADRYDDLPVAERELARRHFDGINGQQEGAFSPAYRYDGIINCGDPDLDGTFYRGSDDAFRLSVFDTADPGMCPPEHREVFERVLTSSPDLMHTILRTDQAVLVAPFPRYATMSVDEILLAIEVTGVSPAKVLLYERDTLGREDVIEKLEQLREGDSKQAEIDEAMAGAAAAPVRTRSKRASVTADG